MNLKWEYFKFHKENLKIRKNCENISILQNLYFAGPTKNNKNKLS